MYECIINNNDMGSIAEDMFTGHLCEGCGVCLEGRIAELAQDAEIPSYCSKECAKDRGAYWWIEWVEKDLKIKI